jgi:hypothetical protein
MNANRWTVAGALIACVFLAAGTSGQKSPNFSGNWKMNLEKSQFGGMPRPDSVEYKIRHSGANLSFDFVQDGKTTHLDFITDGQERATESTPDAEVMTRVFWAGPALTFESRVKARPAHQAEALRWTSRWQLSPDEKSYAMQRHFVTADGEVDQTLIFDRQ